MSTDFELSFEAYVKRLYQAYTAGHLYARSRWRMPYPKKAFISDMVQRGAIRGDDEIRRARKAIARAWPAD